MTNADPPERPTLPFREGLPVQRSPKSKAKKAKPLAEVEPIYSRRHHAVEWTMGVVKDGTRAAVVTIIKNAIVSVVVLGVPAGAFVVLKFDVVEKTLVLIRGTGDKPEKNNMAEVAAPIELPKSSPLVTGSIEKPHRPVTSPAKPRLLNSTLPPLKPPVSDWKTDIFRH